MNLKVGRAVLCAPTPATTPFCSERGGAHGVTRPTPGNRFMAPMRVEFWRLKLPKIWGVHSFLLMLCVASLTACGRTDRAPSPELATNGTVEVTAKLTTIGGEFPPNKLYDYVFVMKYHVLKVHRGTIEGTDIFVGHYNPLKPRATAQDKFSGKVGGDVERFQVGDVHRMALEAPLDQIFMGGIIDKHITEKGTRYRAIWTDRARE